MMITQNVNKNKKCKLKILIVITKITRIIKKMSVSHIEIPFQLPKVNKNAKYLLEFLMVFYG